MSIGGFYHCAPEVVAEPENYRQAKAILLDWNHLLLDLERFTPGYRAPVGGRMIAYVELAAYESVRPALKNYAAASTFCPGYAETDPQELPADYCLPAGLAAAYAQICRDFFPNAPQEYAEKIDRLETRHLAELQGSIPADVLLASAAYGRQTAEKVWAWSAMDMVGHNGFLYNYDQHYTPPKSQGLWQPNNEHAMPALLPGWGHARPFLTGPDQLSARPPLAFNESPGSTFYTEALEVFSVSQSLSKENRWIAEFWSDDLPGLTMSPAGRWLSITNQAIAGSQVPFPEVMATCLKVGLALCDASIICWHEKYKYNVERPETYIRRVIRPGWAPLHESPPFPSYPSGHSIFGAAAARVLAATFGNDFAFTDRSHESRREFAGMPRTFHSFDEMARENAFSRVAIGVHYRMDCEEGLRLGKIIGQKVVNLSLSPDGATAWRR